MGSSDTKLNANGRSVPLNNTASFQGKAGHPRAVINAKAHIKQNANARHNTSAKASTNAKLIPLLTLNTMLPLNLMIIEVGLSYACAGVVIAIVNSLK